MSEIVCVVHTWHEGRCLVCKKKDPSAFLRTLEQIKAKTESSEPLKGSPSRPKLQRISAKRLKEIVAVPADAYAAMWPASGDETRDMARELTLIREFVVLQGELLVALRLGRFPPPRTMQRIKAIGAELK